MKTFSKLLSSLVFVLLVTSATAAPKISCPVDLVGGTIQLGEKLVLRLDKLPRNTNEAYYNISCNLDSIGWNMPHPPVIKVWTSSGGTILVNGKPLHNGQATVNQSPTKLEVKDTVVSKQPNGVIVPSETTIFNLDDSYPIIVSNCHADLAGN